MEDLIERFLLMYKYCPLPNVGTLRMCESSSAIIPGVNQITAPSATIMLDETITDSSGFLDFASKAMGISETEAENALAALCSSLSKLNDNNEYRLKSAGCFKKEDGRLCFYQSELPKEFLPVINLKRVVRPNNVHKVRVGEDERTNMFMSEFLDKTKSRKMNYQWLYVAALTLIGICLIVFYFFNKQGNGTFGNSNSIQIKTELRHYELIQ